MVRALLNQLRATRPVTKDLAGRASGPVPETAVPRQIDKPIARRTVSIVNDDARAGYRLKARLLVAGHRQIDSFFTAEQFLTMLNDGYAPDVVMVDDFVGRQHALTGTELARTLRLEHGFRGLVYTTSDDYRTSAPEALAVHGLSGHAADYLG